MKTLPKMFVIKTNEGKYISEDQIFQDPETKVWLYYFNDKPINMCWCYEHQINDIIARLKEKQKLVGLDLTYYAEEILI